MMRNDDNDGIGVVFMLLALSIAFLVAVFLCGCRTTVDVESESENVTARMTSAERAEAAGGNAVRTEIQKEVVYVEDPEIVYAEDVKNLPADDKVLTGSDALKQYVKDKTVVPEYTQKKLKAWVFRDGQIYQIHCQTYHTTVIQLEPNVEMMEVPYISEPDTWRISRGIGVVKGQQAQFIMLKPDYSGMKSTMVILTNRRVYQFELQSFKDHYMPYVSWVYYPEIESGESWQQFVAAKNVLSQNSSALLDKIDLDKVSIDYTINYSRRKKPAWCPTLVLDNGQKTYIILDKQVLNTEMPAVFEDKRDIINFITDKNVIEIDKLITKVTLRLGKDTVVIQKKKAKK